MRSGMQGITSFIYMRNKERRPFTVEEIMLQCSDPFACLDNDIPI